MTTSHTDEAYLNPDPDVPDLVHVDLVPASSADKPVLADLLQLYLHDFSAIVPLEVGPDGRFDYPPFPLYWSDPVRFPFLATIDGKEAGFVFIKQIPSSAFEGYIWDMAEFFVLRSQRRRGIGVRLAHLVFQRFPGSWQVRVMESNSAAFAFWQKVIAAFHGSEVQPSRVRVDGITWLIFTFESKP